MSVTLQEDESKRPHLSVELGGSVEFQQGRKDNPEMGRWMENMALYQDAEGKKPVTAIGQAIGRIEYDNEGMIRAASKPVS